MLTEDEAKTKWCPFARVSWHAPASPNFPASDGYIGNREVDIGVAPQTYCIGSACMAWRPSLSKALQKIVADNPRAMIEPARPGNVPHQWLWQPYGGPDDPAGWVEPGGEGYGYCGLAGKP